MISFEITDILRFIFFLFGLILPFFFSKNAKYLIYYLSTCLFWDILSVSTFSHLSFYKLAGFFAFYYLIKSHREEIFSIHNFLSVFFTYSILLSVYHFIFPWKDENNLFTFNSILSRNLRQLCTLSLELSTSFCLGSLLSRFEIKNWIKYLINILALASLSSLLTFIFDLDIYSIVTGAKPFVHEFRSRGILFEPRGLGQISVLGLILTFLYETRLIRQVCLISVFILGIFLSSSVLASLLLIGAAIYFLVLIILKHLKILKNQISFKRLIFYATVTLFAIYSANFIYPGRKEHYKHQINQRSYLIENNSFINRFEPFDAITLRLLQDKPELIIFGVGPGLTGAAGSKYMISREKEEFGQEITSPPLTGFVFFLGQFGVIGLIIIYYFIVRALSFSQKENLDKFILIGISFVLFNLQMKYYFSFLIILCAEQIYRSKESSTLFSFRFSRINNGQEKEIKIK